jgi:gliding motility-associated-like protein
VNNTTPALSASCTWDMGDGTIISGCENQDYTYSDVGTFIPSLTVVSPFGCEASYALPAPIEVHGYPTAMFSWSPQPIDPMQPTAYFNNNSIDAVSSFWEFAWLGTSTETNPEFTFPDENLSSYPVCLSVVNEFGCIDTLCKTVIFNNVLQVWVPNAFTPEQDGLNEVFLPIIKGTNPNGYHFSIFDRWGTLIFESFEIGEPWSGDVRDGKGFAQDGTYFWRLEVSLEGNLTIDVYTGFVTVVR